MNIKREYDTPILLGEKQIKAHTKQLSLFTNKLDELKKVSRKLLKMVMVMHTINFRKNTQLTL
jgi:hypothetical protein